MVSFGRGRVPLGLGRGKFTTTKRAPSRFASNCEKNNHQIHTLHKLNFHIAIIHVVSSIPLLISVYTIYYILFIVIAIITVHLHPLTRPKRESLLTTLQQKSVQQLKRELHRSLVRFVGQRFQSSTIRIRLSFHSTK